MPIRHICNVEFNFFVFNLSPKPFIDSFARSSLFCYAPDSRTNLLSDSAKRQPTSSIAKVKERKKAPIGIFLLSSSLVYLFFSAPIAFAAMRKSLYLVVGGDLLIKFYSVYARHLQRSIYGGGSTHMLRLKP